MPVQLPPAQLSVAVPAPVCAIVQVPSAQSLQPAGPQVPVSHPPGFPNIDQVAGLSWSGDLALSLDDDEPPPSQPGVWMLVYGGSGQQEVPVWVEEASDLRARIDGLTAIPQDDRELAPDIASCEAFLRTTIEPLIADLR